MSPKVSVLMPIYNTQEEHLREAIQSILNQTYTDFEFLILNDSPDNTHLDDIVASFQDSRIKYFKNDKNIGISNSRNKLVDLALGEYLAVMDHDDISLPKRFEKEAAYLDAHPDIGVVSCWYTCMVDHRTQIYPTKNDKIVRGILQGLCYILHPASMIRKSVLTLHNLRYEQEFSPAEDFLLWGKLIKYTQFANIPDFLFCYRNHTGNTSCKQSDKMQRSTRKTLSFLASEYAQLYQNYVKHYPCRMLPFITIKSTFNCKKILLFNCIPLLSISINYHGI